MLSCDAGHANARSLDRQDLVDLDALEQTGPLSAHVIEQLNVALVVEEGINLKDDTARLINVVR